MTRKPVHRGDEFRVGGADGVQRSLRDVVNGASVGMDAPKVCPQCGLQFTAGYAWMAHRERDAAGRPSGACLAEDQLGPVLALVCFDQAAQPRWYTPLMGSDIGAAREARLRLVKALRDGTVTSAQVRYVPLVAEDIPESFADAVMMLAKSSQRL